MDNAIYIAASILSLRGKRPDLSCPINRPESTYSIHHSGAHCVRSHHCATVTEKVDGSLPFYQCQLPPFDHGCPEYNEFRNTWSQLPTATLGAGTELDWTLPQSQV